MIQKKAEINTELITIVFSLLFIGIILFVLSSSFYDTKNGFENIIPEISYEYPSLFIYTFLNKQVDEKYLEEAGLKNDQKYKVIDLLSQAEINDKIKEAIEKTRSDYLNTYANPLDSESSLDYFVLFAYNNNKNAFLTSKSNLLLIEYENQKIPNLNHYIINKNYFYYIKNNNQNYVIVYFRPSIADDANNIINYDIDKLRAI